MTSQKRSMTHKVAGATMAALLTGSMLPLAAASAQQSAPTNPAQKVSSADLQAGKGNARFIVTYKNSTDAQNQSSLNSAMASAKQKTSKGSKKIRTLATGADLVQSDAALTSSEATEFMKALAANPNVAAVEPDQLMKPPAFAPADPMYGQQWDFKNTSAGMNVEGAWKYTLGTGVKVAVIDTGITNHPDPNSNVLPGYGFISDTAMTRDGNGRDSLYTLSQQVTLPSTATNATLSFWLRVKTDETTAYSAYDKLTVTITAKTLATYSNLDASGWVQMKLPVSRFAGKEDTADATSSMIDDVTLGQSPQNLIWFL